MSTATATPVVELVNVTRRYGKNYAVRDASLAIHPGEVVGLVGDNGAGKSTIVKMISGYIEPTAGTIKVRGAPVRFGSPRQARAAGIETVYQDLAIVDEMALWRNFFLGQELHRRILGVRYLRVAEMARICDEHLADVGLTSVESSHQTAATLSGGERQSLAISRAIHFDSQLLVLDEPVAALSVRETRRVLDAIGAAKENNLGVLYIDHNMDHVLPAADRIAIMHRGTISRVVNRGDLTVDELADAVAESGTADAESGD
ncbi:MAG: ATP-binding cassette domain-containing protein [bacterium]|nr:ATP-binding cassette domain-containing protein [bacterium]MCY4104212.1 ATP-binding cassette domain-containing protein [bacterium]